MQQVHLRVNDAETGKPTPVRLRITDADGNYYAPHGRLTSFALANQDGGGNVQLDGKNWAYIDGGCEILLPPGKLHVEIAKGPEYEPIDEEITLPAGKMAQRFTIERWCDMRKEGWYSGDARVQFMSPDTALLEAQAEDVAVVNLLAFEHEQSISNIVSFSGQEFARTTPAHGVAVNTLNHARSLGTLSLLHCHRVVYPLTFEPGSDTEWTLADWCDQCHRKKGLVVWAGPRLGEADTLHGEALADLILGKIDAIEVTASGFASVLNDYQTLTDASLHVALVAASSKGNNVMQLGSPRTYAHIEDGAEFCYTAWIEAVRARRTFVSNGPFLQLILDGVVPDAQLKVPADKGVLELSVYAKSLHSYDRCELLWNGEVVADATPASFPHQIEIYHELPVHESGWLSARCVTGSMLSAHTSAVAVCVDGVAPHPKPQAVERLLRELESQLRLSKEQLRGERLIHVIEEARTLLAKKLS